MSPEETVTALWRARSGSRGAFRAACICRGAGKFAIGSVEFATWKFLSDLSHFSFMMLRHLASTPIPGTTVPLLHATVLQFAQTVNRLCGDATEQVQEAIAIKQR